MAAAILISLAGCDLASPGGGSALGTERLAAEVPAETAPDHMPNRPLPEQERALHEIELSFEGEGETLHGTLIVPSEAGPHPAVVLLGGSGPEARDQNRPLGEEFARNGVAALIYDKRTRGYSANPTGARSYALLADDAVAAAELLRTLDTVDPGQVGVWGVSEGGWVAPLAANRTDAIAFVITMSAIGVAPVAQVAWSVGRTLEHRGIRSRSMHRALTERLPRFIVSAEMMGEATYDPVPAVEQLTQPYLGLWGESDSVQPAFESARIMADGLRRGGNRSYTLVLLPDTDHNGYPTEDGFTRTRGEFTLGYVSTMVGWIGEVAEGAPPVSSVETIPPPSGPSSEALLVPSPDVVRPKGFDHWYVQFTNMALFLIGFLGYGVMGVWRWMQARLLDGERTPPPAPTSAAAHRYARIAAVGGTSLWLYALYYLFSVFIDSTAVGGRDIASVVVAGRPGTWLMLQVASIALVACGALLAINLWRSRHQVGRMEAARLTLVLVAVVAFVPWAIHWQLLVP